MSGLPELRGHEGRCDRVQTVLEASMNGLRSCLVLVLLVALGSQLTARRNSTSASAAPLILTGAIPLPNVQGRIDHFGLDPGNRASSLPVPNMSDYRVYQEFHGKSRIRAWPGSCGNPGRLHRSRFFRIFRVYAIAAGLPPAKRYLHPLSILWPRA